MSQIALLINPWIYDFSAYDLWMKPVGLLRVAGYLREQGHKVLFIDCLDSDGRRDKFGCGKFTKRLVEKPKEIQGIPRAFYRYGIDPERFLKDVARPDVVYIGSGMTYWYLGVIEAIRLVRKKWPDIKIVLGGIYANLCRGHALKKSGADEIWNGERITNYPAWDLAGGSDVIVIQTSFGCPFNCSYCGADRRFSQRPYGEVLDEIQYFSPKNIAFYDDALLVNSDTHIKPLLKGVIQRNIKVRFHTPNGLHARFIDRELAVLMKKAGFVTIRIGLETSKENRIDKKVTNEEFLQAVNYLKEAGFTEQEIGVYTMFGSLDDNPDDVIEDIKFVTETAGVPIKLSSYALVPGSSDYKKWGFSDSLDPLWHNKTIFPLLNKRYTLDKIRRLREFASAKNNSISASFSRVCC